MTAVGKLLVFISLILSVASLGVAMWLTVDRHDWKKELEAKKKELESLYPPVQRGDVRRDQLLSEANDGAERKLKLDADRESTVAEARKAVIALIQENDTRRKEYGDLRIALEKSRDDVVAAQSETDKVLAEVNRLSRLVTPEKPDEKGIPARIDELHKERLKADRDFENLYPEIANGEAAVELLQIRNAELKKRQADLKKQLDLKKPTAQGSLP